MAARQPHAVRHACSDADEHVYVVQFSSGSIKVGRTRDPATRLKKHAAAARAHGIEVAAHWVSQAVTNARQNERHLIDFCKSRYRALNDGEYFSDAQIEDVLGFAETLPSQGTERVLMTQVPSMPLAVGRPTVGPKVEVRLDPDTLAKVDARAAEEGVKRAEMLRRIIIAAV